MRIARQTRANVALRYALALIRTTDRYLAGYMARATWDRHMKHLWACVEARGLRAEVVRLVDPLRS